MVKKATLDEYATYNGTDWTDSPHRNGAAEVAVQIVKRVFQSLGKGLNLTYSEFLIALQLAANLAEDS